MLMFLFVLVVKYNIFIRKRWFIKFLIPCYAVSGFLCQRHDEMKLNATYFLQYLSKALPVYLMPTSLPFKIKDTYISKFCQNKAFTLRLMLSAMATYIQIVQC